MFRGIQVVLFIAALSGVGCANQAAREQRAYRKQAEAFRVEIAKTLSFIEVGMTFDEYRHCMQQIASPLADLQNNTAASNPSRDHFLNCGSYLVRAFGVWESLEKRLAANAKIGVREDLTTSAMRRERGELWADAAAEFKAGVVKLEGGS